MEPTPVEMQSFATVPVVLWAQLEGDPLQALLKIWVWKSMITHEFLFFWKSLGRCSRGWSALVNPATPAHKAKAVVARGAAVLTTTYRRVGVQAPVSSIVPSMSIGSGLGVNTVMNQSSEVVMSVLEAGELMVAFGVVPPVEEELTAELLTAVQIYRGLKVGVGVNTWCEFVGEVMKSVRVLY